MLNYSEISREEYMSEYDVVVAGGGVAGVAAALACGKRGYRTLIVEALSALGGLATMGLVNIPLDFVSGLRTRDVRRAYRLRWTLAPQYRR